MSAALPVGYSPLLADLKQRIRAAQHAALRAVNKELIALYWEIGRTIHERQDAEGWGKGVVERLSADLRAEFGEKSGFSARNLWYMRDFFRAYQELPILQPLAAEISWTKNTLILDRCGAPLEREFYLRATARFGWTRRVLEIVGWASAHRSLFGRLKPAPQGKDRYHGATRTCARPMARPAPGGEDADG